MYPALKDGYKIEVEQASNPPGLPKVGDIIVFTRVESMTERKMVKRVVALPGDVVTYKACMLYINGSVIEEPWIDKVVEASDGCGGDQVDVQVPNGTVFVLGDHRGRSADSRAFGPVPLDTIIGTVVSACKPLGDIDSTCVPVESILGSEPSI